MLQSTLPAVPITADIVEGSSELTDNFRGIDSSNHHHVVFFSFPFFIFSLGNKNHYYYHHFLVVVEMILPVIIISAVNLFAFYISKASNHQAVQDNTEIESVSL